jgi:CheY-like chemotaxis protein
MLRRILQNILSNALRYTVEGAVRMTASCRGGEVEVAISDTGPGIDPRHHGEIFEEFRRLDGRNGPGIGLGLAIVERAGRMLGHPIRLDSAIGAGSTFTVGVPLAAVGVRSRRSPVHTGGRGIGARAVLVLDNEQTILDGMRAVLEGWGCRVVTALDEAAVHAAPPGAIAEIDVILADYHLEDGITGDAAVARIRARLGRRVPAVIITADRMPSLRDALVAEGLHVLQKPVKPAQLRALLAQLTTGSR